MSWAVRRPHPVVQPLVSRYIGDEQTDVTLPVHRGLPSRHVTVSISLQQPVRVTGRATTLSARGLVGGLHTEAVLITQDRTQCGIHLELHPLAVRSLFGLSAAELSGRIVGLDDVDRPTLAQLPDRLASTRAGRIGSVSSMTCWRRRLPNRSQSPRNSARRGV